MLRGQRAVLVDAGVRAHALVGVEGDLGGGALPVPAGVEVREQCGTVGAEGEARFADRRGVAPIGGGPQVGLAVLDRGPAQGHLPDRGVAVVAGGEPGLQAVVVAQVGGPPPAWDAHRRSGLGTAGEVDPHRAGALLDPGGAVLAGQHAQLHPQPGSSGLLDLSVEGGGHEGGGRRLYVGPAGLDDDAADRVAVARLRQPRPVEEPAEDRGGLADRRGRGAEGARGRAGIAAGGARGRRAHQGGQGRCTHQTQG